MRTRHRLYYASIVVLFLGLGTHVAAQDRLRIAVVPFTCPNDSASATYLTELLEARIANDRRFVAVGRSDQDKALAELRLSASDLYARDGNDDRLLQFGELLVAQTLITGSMTINATYDSDSKRYKAEAQAIARLVDVERGVLDAAFNVSTSESGEDRSGAKRAAVSAAVGELVLRLHEFYPLQAVIASINGNRAIVNMGLSSGVRSGMTFRIMRDGAHIVDPVSGRLLGTESKEVGAIRIDEVHVGMANASVLRGARSIHVGDRVEETPRRKVPSGRVYASYSPVAAVVDEARGSRGTVGRDQRITMHLGGIGVQVQDVRSHWALDMQAGIMGGPDIVGFVADAVVMYRFPLVRELVEFGVGAGGSFYYFGQELPDPDAVYSALAVSSNDEMAEKEAFGGLGSITMQLGRSPQLFVEATWRQTAKIRDWKIKWFTGEETEEGRAKTASTVVPDDHLKYRSLTIEGLAFRGGLAWEF